MNGYTSTDVLLAAVHARQERLRAEARQERMARAAAGDRHDDRADGRRRRRFGAGMVRMLRHRAA